MQKYKVSVVVPIYNMEKYLEKCLASILGQTLKEIEVLCINDGSIDRTQEILKRYEEKFSNVFVVNQENKGVGLSRNVGIDLARGEYIAFMDPDDYYPNETALEKLYKNAIDKGVSICGGSLYREYEGKIEKKANVNVAAGLIFDNERKMTYEEWQGIGGFYCFIYKASLLKNKKIYFPNYRRFQDPVFLVNAMIYGKEIYVIKEGTYVYRKFDKIVDFTNSRITLDIASAINDILVISKKERLARVHASVIGVLQKAYLVYFYKLILEDNQEMFQLLNTISNNIDEELLIKDGRFKQKPIFKTKEEIVEYSLNANMEANKLLEHVNSFNKVLIYGAGDIGKLLYKFFRRKGVEEKIDFVVTNRGATGTAWGKRILAIDDFIERKNQYFKINQYEVYKS